MAQYFEVSLSYQRLDASSGKVKKALDKYIVEAETFADAEERIVKERVQYMSGEVQVKSVKRKKIAETFNLSASRFWIARLAFIMVDENTGTEKKSIVNALIGADDFDNATSSVKEMMKGTVSDWECVSLVEYPILEVFELLII